jgi:hypothetical protein
VASPFVVVVDMTSCSPASHDRLYRILLFVCAWQLGSSCPLSGRRFEVEGNSRTAATVQVELEIGRLEVVSRTAPAGACLECCLRIRSRRSLVLLGDNCPSHVELLKVVVVAAFDLGSRGATKASSGGGVQAREAAVSSGVVTRAGRGR